MRHVIEITDNCIKQLLISCPAQDCKHSGMLASVDDDSSQQQVLEAYVNRAMMTTWYLP